MNFPDDFIFKNRNHSIVQYLDIEIEKIETIFYVAFEYDINTVRTI